MHERRFDLENGKYTLILAEDGYTVTALRGGEPWREFVGDKFISLLTQRFFEALDDAAYDYGTGYPEGDYPDDLYPLTLQEARDAVNSARADGDNELLVYRAPKGGDFMQYTLLTEGI